MENLILILALVSFLSYLSACFWKNRFFSVSSRLFLSSNLLASLYLLLRHFLQVRRFPLSNTSETLLFLIIFIILVYLLLEFRLHLPGAIGAMVSLISGIGFYLSFQVFQRPLLPLLPALQSKWLVLHVLSSMSAYGFFALAFLAGLFYLFTSREAISIFALMHRSICIGFFFFTAGIISGSIWGKYAWGNWWNWDPKEVWALLSWSIFGVYIHAKNLNFFSRKKLALLAILGFLSCIFTYLGVNYLLKGLHSYG